MKILDGKKLQKNLLNDIKNKVCLLGIKPKLFVVSIEEQEINKIYLRQIKKMCDTVGFECESMFFEAITENSLLKLIEEKNKDLDVTGILVLSPMPYYLDEEVIYNHILPKKDVEALGITNQLQIIQKNSSYYPCTVASIISLLKFHNIDVEEKNVVIINRSKRIGKPLFYYFLNNDCTVTMMHSKSKENTQVLKEADIIITAVGKGSFIDSDIFKNGSTVIDLGMFYQDGKIVGDVILNEGKEINYISHTGGVGSVTVASLARNILNSYYLLHEDK